MEKRGKDLMQLYLELVTEYGKQNWWPAETPYEVMVGAVLTQNTNWKNVEKAIDNLKKEGLLTSDRILETENSKLETLIRSSGYYRQKAERLKLASKKWIEIQTELKTGYSELKTAELREVWLSVTGIGPETADSICLYAFNRSVFVVDAYTRRFCKHFELFEAKTYEKYQEFFESNLPKDVELYKEYHALIVEWAKNNPKSKTGN
jgi:endonuclease-3 related protein